MTAWELPPWYWIDVVQDTSFARSVHRGVEGLELVRDRHTKVAEDCQGMRA